jgi:hypothetical protein
MARKLIGSCHFQHFWRVVLALAGMQGRRSLNRMQGLFKGRRTRQAIADFLKKAAWDAPEVLRQQALDLLGQLGCRAGDTVYLLLDDTQKRKRGKRMDALKKIFLHAEKVYATGHTMLGAALVFRGVVIPFRISLWACEDFCRSSQREPDPADRLTFRKLTELAAGDRRSLTPAAATKKSAALSGAFFRFETRCVSPVFSTGAVPSGRASR